MINAGVVMQPLQYLYLYDRPLVLFLFKLFSILFLQIHPDDALSGSNFQDKILLNPE